MEKSVEPIKWETKKCYWDKDESNILKTMERRKTTRIGLILRRNCLPKHATEGKIWKSSMRWSQEKIVMLFNFQLLKQNYETPRRISTAFSNFIVNAATASFSLC